MKEASEEVIGLYEESVQRAKDATPRDLHQQTIHLLTVLLHALDGEEAGMANLALRYVLEQGEKLNFNTFEGQDPERVQLAMQALGLRFRMEVGKAYTDVPLLMENVAEGQEFIKHPLVEAASAKVRAATQTND